MPAPSEVARHLRVGTPAEMADAVTRSHLPDGRCVGWYGVPGVVIDAEDGDRPVPSRLAERYGAERFWERWTAAECRAKASGVPIARWLGRHGLDGGRAGPPPVRVLRLDGLVVSWADPETSGDADDGRS